MLFAAKKIISALLLPLPIGLGFLLIGLFLLWATETKRLQHIFFLCGFLIIFLFSLHPVSAALLNGLQNRYKPLISIPVPVTQIVVLGGGISGKKSYPPNLTLASASLSRLVEGVRLYKLLIKENPNATLILSGGRVFDNPAVAGLMQNTAALLGVDPSHMRLENGSIDTHSEALYLKKTLQDEPFILVTSAYHMPRAMALFEKLGMRPIPAPTQFSNTYTDPYTLYLPSAVNLVKSDVAIHEYLGLLYAKYRKEI